MFNTTLMEPTAYRHFVQTGQFREGTMLALILQGIGTNATPARQGQFATDVHVIEMAVKDTGRVPEGWAYYAFGGPMAGGYRSTAAPQPKSSCYSCHAEACRARQRLHAVLRPAEGGHSSRQVKRQLPPPNIQCPSSGLGSWKLEVGSKHCQAPFISEHHVPCTDGLWIASHVSRGFPPARKLICRT